MIRLMGASISSAGARIAPIRAIGLNRVTPPTVAIADITKEPALSPVM
jgi:hypothetical protein